MIELLKENPRTAKLLHDYYLNLMIESSRDLPSHFREFVEEQGLEMSNIASMIETAPRNLFDVFDEQELIISITYDRKSNKFCYFINESKDKKKFDTRKEADKSAVEAAIEMLENKLSSLEETNEDS